MAIISLKNVVKQYGPVRALDGLDFEVAAGEWVAVMGPSGSGKTTLLNMLGCLDVPTSGNVVIDDRDAARLDPDRLAALRREKVGFVFQQFHLVPHLTALENVMLAQYFHSMADEQEASAALERVGLGQRTHHKPSQLSGGEQQRVCIARALINEPPILLADEPTGNLDEASERQVLRILSELHAAGTTIVLVTHNPAVGGLADRRVALEHGRIAGSHATLLEAEQEIDETLERIWHLSERRELTLTRLLHGDNPVGRGLLRKMQEGRLVSLDRDTVAFTPAGESRARSLIRRARLAETLFRTTLGMDRHAAEKEACTFEHILSDGVTDRICAFLDHPEICPHGYPIPHGPCCEAALATVEASVS